MIEGICQKIETLSDGSCKISIYVNKELLGRAVELAYQQVSVTLATQAEKPGKAELLTGIKNAMERIAEMLKEEGSG